MRTLDVIAVLACLGQFALGLVVVTRGARSLLALPLGLLCFDLALWNAASLGGSLHLAAFSAPLIAPLALHTALGFVGRRRALRPALVGFYLVSGALSLASLVTALSPRARAAGLLVTAGAALALAITSLAQYLRQATGADERTRAGLFLGAALAGGALGSTELLTDLGLALPRLGALATLACAALMAVATLRFQLLEREPSARVRAYALGLAALGLVAYATVLALAGLSVAMRAVGVAAVTVALVAAVRRGVVAYLTERARVRQLATLGQVSWQLAHDLKNPLTVFKGATMFLKEEHARGHSLADHGEFLNLLVQHVEQMERILRNYERLGRVEVVRGPVDVNEVVRAVLALQSFATGAKVAVRAELAEGLAACPADRDLLENALKNLVANAFEAMPAGGTLTVRTARAALAEGDGVVVSIEDTGVGMDARTLERALETFYTTKPRGSGLGLAFARRVADAHGGELVLTSAPGRGTIARVRLPTNP